MRSWDEGLDFRELLKSDESVTSHISADELVGLFDYGYYLKHVKDTFRRIGLAESEVLTGQAVTQ